MVAVVQAFAALEAMFPVRIIHILGDSCYENVEGNTYPRPRILKTVTVKVIEHMIAKILEPT